MDKQALSFRWVISWSTLVNSISVSFTRKNNFSLVSEYFTIFYAVCVIALKETLFKPVFPESKTIAFNYDDASNSSRQTFRKAVEVGCQAFVISDEVFLLFLADFHEVHDDCIQVFPNKHVLVYQSGTENNLSKFKDSYQLFPSIDGENDKYFLDC